MPASSIRLLLNPHARVHVNTALRSLPFTGLASSPTKQILKLLALNRMVNWKALLSKALIKIGAIILFGFCSLQILFQKACYSVACLFKGQQRDN